MFISKCSHFRVRAAWFFSLYCISLFSYDWRRVWVKEDWERGQETWNFALTQFNYRKSPSFQHSRPFKREIKVGIIAQNNEETEEKLSHVSEALKGKEFSQNEKSRERKSKVEDRKGKVLESWLEKQKKWTCFDQIKIQVFVEDELENYKIYIYFAKKSFRYLSLKFKKSKIFFWVWASPTLEVAKKWGVLYLIIGCSVLITVRWYDNFMSSLQWTDGCWLNETEKSQVS